MYAEFIALNLTEIDGNFNMMKQLAWKERVQDGQDSPGIKN